MPSAAKSLIRRACTFGASLSAPKIEPSLARMSASPRSERTSAAVKSPWSCTIAMSPSFQMCAAPVDVPIERFSARAAGSSIAGTEWPA